MSTVEKKSQWQDEEEDETPTPAMTGTKEVISYTTNAKGQNVKVISKVKTTEIKRRVPKRVAARKNLPKFGVAAKADEDNVTLRSPDFVFMEHPSDQLPDDAADPSLAKTLANFIQKQQERGIISAVTDLDKWADSETTTTQPVVETKPAEASTGKYVPPSHRAGGPGAGARDERRSGEPETTLRVSNLTKAATEDDLRELFGRFGYLQRVAMPKNDKGEPRGFAYLTYGNRESAEIAMEKLQGFGYDHLILKIEWSKSTKPSSMNTTFSSGYRSKLAQDTTEKAVYFSQQNI